MRVLITGATGLLGRRVVAKLAPAHEVLALSRRPLRGATEQVSWIEQDLLQGLDAHRLPSQIDAVMHLAQSQRYKEFPEGALDVFAVNVASTAGLLDYARRAGAQTFVLASTGGVYQLSPKPIAEDTPPVPTDPYFRSKYAAELLLANYVDVLRAVVVRPFFVYGPGQVTAVQLVPRLTARILAGETVQVEGDPGLRINPLYVDDAARAFEATLDVDSAGTFNLAGDEVVTVTDLVQAVAAACGREARIEHRSPGPPADMVGDNTRMKEELGVVPSVDLSEGLRAVVAEVRSARTQAPA
jgi:UDP-glucose 4-epimerase